MGQYLTAQICLKGHVITDSADKYPSLRETFCSKCSSQTIMACTNCNAPIRGDYYVESVISAYSDYTAPAFCHSCGKPFPWTEERLTAAKLIIEEDESLVSEDKATLVASLPDISSDTPSTNLAATRFKRITGKAARSTSDALRQIVIEIASESAKKILFPG